MNPKLKNLTELYADLERGMQEIIRVQCSPLCSQCTQICCRADICEEALESPFLRLVHRQSDIFSDRYGFLTENGCGLEVGRAPVCHEYFCSDQLYHQPDETHEKMLCILGALIGHAGRNALGNTHLVEIMQEEQLETISFKTLEKQFMESFKALEILKTFFDDGTLSDRDEAFLSTIQFMPEDYP